MKRLVGSMILTLTVNVLANEALVTVTIPQETAEARGIWVEHSGTWKFWNLDRCWPR